MGDVGILCYCFSGIGGNWWNCYFVEVLFLVGRNECLVVNIDEFFFVLWINWCKWYGFFEGFLLGLWLVGLIGVLLKEVKVFIENFLLFV